MTYLYRDQEAAQKAANWLAANHVTPSTQISLSIKSVSKDAPIRIIAAKEGMGKTLKHQKWIVTSNSGSFQAIVEGDDLRKGNPHEAQETENWGRPPPCSPWKMTKPPQQE